MTCCTKYKYRISIYVSCWLKLLKRSKMKSKVLTLQKMERKWEDKSRLPEGWGLVWCQAFLLLPSSTLYFHSILFFFSSASLYCQNILYSFMHYIFLAYIWPEALLWANYLFHGCPLILLFSICYTLLWTLSSINTCFTWCVCNKVGVGGR